MGFNVQHRLDSVDRDGGNLNCFLPGLKSFRLTALVNEVTQVQGQAKCFRWSGHCTVCVLVWNAKSFHKFSEP